MQQVTVPKSFYNKLYKAYLKQRSAIYEAALERDEHIGEDRAMIIQFEHFDGSAAYALFSFKIMQVISLEATYRRTQQSMAVYHLYAKTWQTKIPGRFNYDFMGKLIPYRVDVFAFYPKNNVPLIVHHFAN